MESKLNYCPECGKAFKKEEIIYEVQRMRKIPFTKISVSFGQKGKTLLCAECFPKISFCIDKKHNVNIDYSKFNW